MLIHLSDVLSEEGKRVEYTLPLESKGVDYHGQYCTFGEEAGVGLVLFNKGDHQVELELDGKVHVMIPCDRCLEPTDTVVELHDAFTIDMKNKFVPGETEEEAEEMPEEHAYLQDFDLNTEELIREVLSFSMPEKVLCKEDCKGYCPQCGQNLNTGTCNCDDQPKDPRMAAILDLFNAEFK